MTRNRRNAFACVAMAVLSVLVFATPARAAEPKPPVLHGVTGSATPTVSTVNLEIEENLRRVQTAAAQRSALGAYYDDAESEYVVVTPAEGPGSELTADDFADLNLPVRVEQSDYTQQQITAVADDVAGRSWHPEADQFSYASFFDFESGQTILDSDAPADVMAPLLDQYPGGIDYEQNQVQRNSRYAEDAFPRIGGAALVPNADLNEDINAPMKCTGGFAVLAHDTHTFPGFDFSSEYLLTAGHCAEPGRLLIQWTPRTEELASYYAEVFYRAPFPEYDMELLGNTVQAADIWAGTFYIGSGDEDTQVLVGRNSDAGDPVAGAQDYCYSGAKTFENCDLKMYSARAQLCTKTAGCTRELAAYRPADITADVPAQPSDSGAPLYQYKDCEFQGSLFTCAAIRGMHLGSSGRFMYGVKWSTIASGTPFGWDYISVDSVFEPQQ